MRKKIPYNFIPDGSRWTFVSLVQRNNYKLKQLEKAIYKCSCGTVKELHTNSIKAGASKSCGCYNIEVTTKRCTKHGYWHHPAYRVWSKVKTRCYDDTCREYKDYGGRGVVMCDEWKDNPKAFVEWCLGNGYQKGLDIDKDIIAEKLDVEPLLYSPERCLFVTRKENLNHKRDNVRVTFNGITRNVTQWAEATGISRDCIRHRLNSKWPIEKALTTPAKITKKKR